jgi:hypothetical protein
MTAVDYVGITTANVNYTHAVRKIMNHVKLVLILPKFKPSHVVRLLWRGRKTDYNLVDHSDI